jgi:ABC-type Fe3+/spermidine/putrescine transport system ATPase subunit
MGRLRIEDLTISYDARPVIERLSLEIADGEFVALLGPSGSGKTTILKAVAGLLQQASGRILIDDHAVDRLPAEKRNTVLIFQKPMLFPFLDVGRNIGFGLKMMQVEKSAREKKIDRMLALTGLEGLKNRKVHQLSGGQQQRVALARGLVLEPSILLLDEPFSSLDVELRLQMRELVRNLQVRTGTTMLFVTHDQSEAFAISDRICLLLDGTLRQSGPPEELFYHPADRDVASFFGCNNFIVGNVRDGLFHSDLVTCPVAVDNIEEATATIRPEDILLKTGDSAQGICGKVERLQFEGSTTRLLIRTGHHQLSVISVRPDFCAGQEVKLLLPADRIHLLKKRVQS